MDSMNGSQSDFRAPEGFEPDLDSDADKLEIVFAEAVSIMRDLGEGFSSHAKRLSTINSRLGEGRFHLAVLGQFKRGKSTLLNALVGYPLLPTSVIPLTAIPTFMEYGSEVQIRIIYKNGTPDQVIKDIHPTEATSILEKFVTEGANPKNELGVEQVEISFPAQFLSQGVILIDTPGIGSTLTHNTEATLNFLPQCDAALFVVSADPPITEVEIQFLKSVKEKIDKIFFVLNKIDYLSESERDASLSFLKKTLAEEVGYEGQLIFCVSARNGLEAKIIADRELWADSGVGEIESYLADFLAADKMNALCQALKKQARNILEDCVMRLALMVKSMNMPIDDLEQRLAVFERELQIAENQRISSQDILSGHRKRMLQKLEDDAESLRNRSTQSLERVVKVSMDAMKEGDISEDLILDSIAQEVRSFFQEASEEIEQRYGTTKGQTLHPIQLGMDELIESVRKTASQLFDIPHYAPHSCKAFEIKKRPSWVVRKRVPSLPIIIQEENLDKLLPRSIRWSRLQKRLARQVYALVRHNVENIRWATLQNLNDTFQRFGRILDERFRDTIAATHGAIQAAYIKRKEHSSSIEDNLQKFSKTIGRLERMIKRLYIQTLT